MIDTNIFMRRTGVVAVCFVALMLLFWQDVQAQNSTSSPVSIFGIGEIESRDFGRTAGMGSVGIGLQSQNFLNRRNPAGLSGIDTLRFILDVSASVKVSEFSTSLYSGQTFDFNFKSLAAGVRLSKRWTSSIGLTPYSNVGYETSLPGQEISGTTETVNAVFSGGGGVNNFYWANAFELFRGFSLGVTSSYLFGNIHHTADEDMMTTRETFQISKIYFDFGAQYSHWFGTSTQVTVGGVYGYESKMSVEHHRHLSSGGVTEFNRQLPDMQVYIPESYGAGFSILRNKNAAEWLFAADYHYHNGAIDPLRHESLSYADSHLYSAGLQLTPNKNRPEKYIQYMRFHIGANYNRTYLRINGYQVEDYSVSLGVGLPFRNSSYVNLSINLGESATGKRGGITERYILFTANLSLIERWFAKRLIE